mgnify:CR=1 FL=1
MEKAVTFYLSTLDIPISERYCKKRIASHPDYPSILAVSDTLHQLGINHTVARADMKQPNQIPLTALFHLEVSSVLLLDRQKQSKTLGCDCFRAWFARAVAQHLWLPREPMLRFLPRFDATQATPSPIKAEEFTGS